MKNSEFLAWCHSRAVFVHNVDQMDSNMLTVRNMCEALSLDENTTFSVKQVDSLNWLFQALFFKGEDQNLEFMLRLKKYIDEVESVNHVVQLTNRVTKKLAEVHCKS
jgi:hypothetical protein